MAAAREKSSRPANAPCGVAVATSTLRSCCTPPCSRNLRQAVKQNTFASRPAGSSPRPRAERRVAACSFRCPLPPRTAAPASHPLRVSRVAASVVSSHARLPSSSPGSPQALSSSSKSGPRPSGPSSFLPSAFVRCTSATQVGGSTSRPQRDSSVWPSATSTPPKGGSLPRARIFSSSDSVCLPSRRRLRPGHAVALALAWKGRIRRSGVALA